ncbi:hypothetical protein FOL47_004929 [Perkinsus chesapeaki]|uniref:Uncharacterized protein n=1 Tax=Perkinsus chesapeaki TaxID=330153 RepID=A0A7J6KIT4_PERCH|nr:hypothetical protein FOL47_004929 [Perkinsus chesapeaki]
MVIDRLIEAVLPPTIPIATAVKAVVVKKGLDSLELLSCISADDWKALLLAEKDEVLNALNGIENEPEGAADKVAGSQQDDAGSANKSPAGTDNKFKKLDNTLMTQMKCYGVALSNEAKRWSKHIQQKSDLEGKDAEDRDKDDDHFMSDLI